MTPLTQWDSLKKGLGEDLDQYRAMGEFAGLARETPCDGDRAHSFPFPGLGSNAVQTLESFVTARKVKLMALYLRPRLSFPCYLL